MRNCKQTQCAFLRLKQGCKKCSDCGVSPFIISEDCLRCYDCENIPNSCRWGEDGNNIIDIPEKEKKKKKKKLMEIEAK